MASVTFAVDNSLKEEIEKFPWVNWSNVVREEAIRREHKQRDFEEFRKIVSKSKLTEKDVAELAEKINRGMHEKLKKLYPGLR
jgi:hypothetical protein